MGLAFLVGPAPLSLLLSGRRKLCGTHPPFLYPIFMLVGKDKRVDRRQTQDTGIAETCREVYLSGLLILIFTCRVESHRRKKRAGKY